MHIRMYVTYDLFHSMESLTSFQATIQQGSAEPRIIHGVIKEKEKAEQEYRNNIQNNLASVLARQIRRKNKYFIINIGCISHDAHVTIEYRYLMELRKVKGHDERRLAEENFDHMAGRVNRASPLYQLEIPFEDHYGERERPSFDHSARIQQNIEEGIEEVGLDFNGYRQLESNQISIELTTDELIRLRRQAFEDVEIEPSGPIQQNGEFPPVVQRFNLKRLLEMPDDFGDIKQISLDIEFLTQPRHEYKKQFLSHDLSFVHTTTQNANVLTCADQFFKKVNIFQTAVSNRNFNPEENFVRIMAGIQLEKLFDFHWPHESPQTYTGMVIQDPQPVKKEFIFLLDTRRIMFSYLKEMKNSIDLMLQSLPRDSKFNIYRNRF